MTGVWRGCEGIVLLIALFIASTPSEGQPRTVTQSQIEAGLKRFRTIGNLSHAEKVNQILECLNPKRLCDNRLFLPDYFRSTVANEILLRGQWRERGEECTSVGKPFDGPVPAHYTADFVRFQDELLDSGLTFCNPLKHLSCSPQKKCECGPGTAFNPEVSPDVCTLSIGGYCLKAKPLYDPFNSDNIVYTTDIPDLKCTVGASPDCSSFEYSARPFCASDAMVELDKKLVNYFGDSPRLTFGDPCNSERHKELLKPTEADVAGYIARANQLKAIMEAKTRFCDLRRLLVCGSAGKCECIKPAFYDENKKNCTYRHPHEACQQRFVVRDMSANFTRLPREEVNEGAEDIQKRECKIGCGSDFNRGRPSPSYCKICPSYFNVGRNCDKILTLFLSGHPQIELPRDEPDFEKQIDLLGELSDKATELEDLMHLNNRRSCDKKAELEAARAIRRIKNLDVVGTVATKDYYRDTIRFTDEVIRNYSAIGFCQYNPFRITTGWVFSSKVRPDFVCGPMNATDAKCTEMFDGKYLGILRERLIPFHTLGVGKPCPMDLDRLVQSVGARYRGETETLYRVLVEQLETHFVNETHFCNATADLVCQGNFTFVTDFGRCGLKQTEDRNGTVNATDTKSGVLRVNAPNPIHVSFLLIHLFTSQWIDL